MTEITHKTHKVKEEILRYRESTKVRGDLIRETQREAFEKYKLRHENNNSILDFVLQILSQFLSISATVYIGLLVVPPNILNNQSLVLNILQTVGVGCVLLIIVALILKVKLSSMIDSVINQNMNILNHLIKSEADCEQFCQNKLDEISDIEELSAKK